MDGLSSTRFPASGALSSQGGPEHFARSATAMATPPLLETSWDDLHLLTFRLRPGGWSHPGSRFIRLTIPLSTDGHVRRRLPGDGKGWTSGIKRKGTFSLTPPGAEGEWAWSDPSHFGLMFLPPATIRQVAEEHGVDPDTFFLNPVFAEPDAVVGAVFHSIMSEITDRQTPSRLHISSAELFLASHLFRRSAPHVKRSEIKPGLHDRQRLLRVLDAVDAQLDKDWSVPQLASEANLSPYWFAHLFKLQVGVSPRRFIQERRLECARRMLAESDLPVTEVALHCGFQNLSWFSTSFRRRYGCSPAVFRKSLRSV